MQGWFLHRHVLSRRVRLVRRPMCEGMSRVTRGSVMHAKSANHTGQLSWTCMHRVNSCYDHFTSSTARQPADRSQVRLHTYIVETFARLASEVALLYQLLEKRALLHELLRNDRGVLGSLFSPASCDVRSGVYCQLWVFRSTHLVRQSRAI
jgi:hypothetical protein